MIRFAIVGTGWRSHFFLRTAAACPDRFKVTALVSRTPEKKEEFHRRYGVALVPSLDDAIATNPLFILTSLPMAVTPVCYTSWRIATCPCSPNATPARRSKT